MHTSWQSGDIEANGIRLHYTRTGGDKPPLVLAHGFSDDGLCWTPVAEALAGTYDVIMVDARGHGRSEEPKEPFGAEDQAADLAGVIAGLGLGRPPVLGHSMGAVTTLGLAALHPERVGAILLEDPPPWWVPAPTDAPSNEERLAAMRDRLVSLKQKTREQLLADQRAATPGWSEAELEPWADAKLRVSLNVINRRAAAQTDWPALARQIKVPALLITADPEHGAIVDAASAAALHALMPQLRVAHIAGAGHSIRRDQFTRYMDVVRGFLAALS